MFSQLNILLTPVVFVDPKVGAQFAPHRGIPTVFLVLTCRGMVAVLQVRMSLSSH